MFITSVRWHTQCRPLFVSRIGVAEQQTRTLGVKCSSWIHHQSFWIET